VLFLIAPTRGLRPWLPSDAAPRLKTVGFAALDLTAET
jgi:hypothetical protein